VSTTSGINSAIRLRTYLYTLKGEVYLIGWFPMLMRTSVLANGFYFLFFAEFPVVLLKFCGYVKFISSFIAVSCNILWFIVLALWF
jgi:hypothetical protein